MDMEYSALQNKQTWVLVLYKSDMNVVGCKWVYQTKVNVDGTINKHKARLVAKGFHQVPGVDFAETFLQIAGEPIEPLTEIFRIRSGEAHFWTMADILKEPELERIRF